MRRKHCAFVLPRNLIVRLFAFTPFSLNGQRITADPHLNPDIGGGVFTRLGNARCPVLYISGLGASSSLGVV